LTESRNRIFLGYALWAHQRTGPKSCAEELSK